MILKNSLPDVKALLAGAGRSGTTVSYRQLHALFDEVSDSVDVYDTLEAACRELADRQDAIYEAVLIKKQTNLPGDGFFDVYQNNRFEEYRQIAGQTSVQDLSEDLKTEIVLRERKRVYNHARR